MVLLTGSIILRGIVCQGSEKCPQMSQTSTTPLVSVCIEMYFWRTGSRDYGGWQMHDFQGLQIPRPDTEVYWKQNFF